MIFSRQARRWRSACALVATSAALFAVTGCGSDNGSDDSASTASGTGTTQDTGGTGELKTVKVVTQAPYPPTLILDSAGNYSGSDLDLIKAVLEKGGMRPAFSNLKNYDALVPAVQAGRFDIAVAGIGDNPDRQKVVNLVDYNEVKDSVVAKKGVTSLDQLCGKKMGVTTGSIGMESVFQSINDDVCADNPVSEVKVVSGGAAYLAGLGSGRLDAFIDDALSAEKKVKARSDIQVVGDPLPIPAGGLTGFVVAKSNCELAQKLQEGLKAVIEDGTYDKIMDQYGTQFYSYKKATINQQPTLDC